MAASYPTSVKAFTSKVDGVDDVMAADINEIQDEVEAVETDLLNNLQDYSSISTITGWTSFTQKQLGYVKSGKRVYFIFQLVGTSNSINTNFTLPYNNNMGWGVEAIIRTTDNGVTQVGRLHINSNENLVYLYPTVTGGLSSWTASGTKAIYGYISYYTN